MHYAPSTQVLSGRQARRQALDHEAAVSGARRRARRDLRSHQRQPVRHALRLSPRLLRRRRARVPRLRHGRAVGHRRVRRAEPRAAELPCGHATSTRPRTCRRRSPRTWFHTGVYLGRERVSSYFAGLLDDKDAGEYYREPGLTDAQARAALLADTVLPAGLTPEEEREACRALKGAMLRQEVYALDGAEQAGASRIVVTEQNFTVRLAATARRAIVTPCSSPTRAKRSAIQYERNPDRSAHRAHAHAGGRRPFGNVLKSAAVGYGRQHGRTPRCRPKIRPRQAERLVTLHRERLHQCDRFGRRLSATPLPSESPHATNSPGSRSNHGETRLALRPAACGGNRTAAPLAYEHRPLAGNRLQKRLIEHVRTSTVRTISVRPRGDPLALLAAGRNSNRSRCPARAYKLAFTPGAGRAPVRRQGRPTTMLGHRRPLRAPPGRRELVAAVRPRVSVAGSRATIRPPNWRMRARTSFSRTAFATRSTGTGFDDRKRGDLRRLRPAVVRRPATPWATRRRARQRLSRAAAAPA